MGSDAELETLKAENAELLVQLDVLEQSRLEVLTMLGEEELAHNATREKLARYETSVRQIFDAIDRFRS